MSFSSRVSSQRGELIQQVMVLLTQRGFLKEIGCEFRKCLKNFEEKKVELVKMAKLVEI